ncbi:MAG TPA: hypothetical protein VES67_11385 [Vicinamibacterales bacterium]|nr:hypothetical protein [Vicinamibacterales bacterium]
MSPDEVVVTIAAVVLGPVAWVFWFIRRSDSTLPGRGSTGLGILGATIVVCSTLLLFVLVTVASHDVRTVLEYLFMYSVLGLAWLRLGEMLFAYSGVSVRDDVVERGNAAATIALSGALVAVMLCYAGANIGDGPGWWVVVFSAALATAGLVVAWQLYALFTRGVDAVTIDRDPAAGMRLAGFLVACGLVLGRSVAGDWHAVEQTVQDFVRMLPFAGILVVLATAIEPLARPTVQEPHRPFGSHGVGLGLLYVLFAVIAIAFAGWPQ